MTTLVLTVIGDDRPGLVKAIAALVQTRGGNWERSQLTSLAGQFAGLVQISVDDEDADALVAALESLDGLDVRVRRAAEPASHNQVSDDQTLVLDLLGNDRHGIVDEVSGVLARHGANVEVWETLTRDAPMAGGSLFQAHAEVRVPTSVDLVGLRADLERLAAELMVDLDLEDLGHPARSR